MRKEATGKKKGWLWLVLILAVLLIGGAVAAVALLGGEEAPPEQVRPDLYWNVDRHMYAGKSETGLSGRMPEADGQYHFRFAYNGQLVEYTTQDKRMVNMLDSFDLLCLTVDDSGAILDATSFEEKAMLLNNGVYFHKALDGAFQVNSSMAMNGMNIVVELSDMLEIYDVSTSAANPGAVTDYRDIPLMARMMIYGPEEGVPTHAYIVSHPETSPIYWRVEEKYNRNTQSTTRVPENGVYSIEFYTGGGKVILQTKDLSTATAIDRQNFYNAAFAFVFDEEGYITDTFDTGVAIRGRLACSRLFVTEVNGNTFTAVNRAAYTDTVGNFTGTITEDTKIYDVSWQARSENRDGMEVDGLKVDDMINVWTDLEGNVVLIYIANSVVDSPSYYNVSRQYNATTGTTRTPNYAGYYEFELLSEGAIKTYRTKDKALADYLDSQSSRVVGLKLEGDVIRAVYPHMAVYGYYNAFNGYYVRSVMNPVFTVSLTEDSATITGLMTSDCKVIDVSTVGPIGSETELRKGDRCVGFVNPDLNYVEVYVLGRFVEESQLYYNIERKFDAETKTTTRTPDGNGWYVFDMAVDGKRVNVRTSSKAIATKIDGYSPQIMGMVVSGGVVQNVFDPYNVTGGAWACSGAFYEGTDGSGRPVYTHNSNGVKESCAADESNKIFNVGLLFDSYQGEATTLQPGDFIMAFTNSNGEIVRTYVRQRFSDTLYWNMEPLYDADKKETMRKPDANGYYVYQLAGNGKLHTFKTKSKKVATAVDAQNYALAIRRSGSTILSAAGYNYVKGLHSEVAPDWDVTSVSGSRIVLKNNRPGYSNTGTSSAFTLSPNVKIYDVTPDAKRTGAVTNLRIGDRVRVFRNKEGNIEKIFVWAHQRVSYCEHCEQNVLWNPYVGGRFMPASGHFYLPRNVRTASLMNIGAKDYAYEVVLDLNGKTITRLSEGRTLMVSENEKMTIMDTVGEGAICGYGADGVAGGLAILLSGAKLNLMSGSLRLLESEYKMSRGGNMYIDGKDTVFNMMGGSVEGGYAQPNDKHDAGQGGNIFCYQATINLSGGEITGGKVSGINCLGANVVMATDSTLNMTGGKITGASGAVRGSSIYIGENAVVNMTDGEISGGQTEYLGGNIYLAAGSFQMSGGTVTGGHAGMYGGNVYAEGKTFAITGGSMVNGTADLGGSNVQVISTADIDITIGGGTMDGGLYLNVAKSLLLTGNPVITDKDDGLSLRYGVLATLGDLKEGASIYVKATDAFTHPSDKAQTYLDAGYFKTAKRNKIVVVEDVLHMQSATDDELTEKNNLVYDRAVKMTEDGVFESGEIVEAVCPYCDATVQWQPLTNASENLLPVPEGNSAHYYLAEDITYTGKGLQIPQDEEKMDGFCLHLNGHNLTSTDEVAVSVGFGSALNVMGDGVVMGAGAENKGAALDAYSTVNLMGGIYRASVDNYVLTENHETAKVSVFNGTKLQVTDNHSCGAVYMATAESRFYLYGGEVDATGGRGFHLTNGKVYQYGGKVYGAANSNVYMTGSAVYNMLGGVIEGGTAAGGGNVRVERGTFAMNADARITGGNATVVGGNICVVGGNFLAYGGTVENGTAPNGGNIYLNSSASTVSISQNGPTVTGGTATNYGGNIFVTSGKLVVDAGTVENGTAKTGANIWVDGDKAFATLSNVELSGGVHITKAENLILSGKLVIGKDAGGLIIDKGTLADVTGLTEGASIWVKANGVFTTTMDDAKAYLDAGYFKAPARHTITVVDNALSVQMLSAEELKQIYDKVHEKADEMTEEGIFTGEKVEAYCPSCLETVTWQPLAAATGEEATVLSGHYYLASDLTANTNYYTTGGNTCVHLNGKALTTSSGIALQAAAGTELNVMGSGTVTAAGVRTAGAMDVKGALRLMGGTYTTENYYIVAATAAGAEFYMFEGTTLNGGGNAAYAIICTQNAMLHLMGGDVNCNGILGLYLTNGKTYLEGTDIHATKNHAIRLASGNPTVYHTAGTVSGSKGSNVFIQAGIYNFTGGTIEGGSAAGGGNVRLEGGTFNMNGSAMLSGGTGSVLGGNLYAENANVNIWGGTVKNGTAPNGGNIYINSNAVFYMGPAPEGVEGGTPVVTGGNIHVNSATLTLAGGTVTEGGICANNANASVTLSGGTVDGNVQLMKVKDAALAGTVTIGEKDGGLVIEKGVLVDVSGLEEGASIYLTADGIFTTNSIQAQYVLDADIFRIPKGYNITLEGLALSMKKLTEEDLQAIYNSVAEAADEMTDNGIFTGEAVSARCPYCLEKVTWQPLTQASSNVLSAENGTHYYLAENITYSGQYLTTEETDEARQFCLHLNSKIITATDTRAVFVPVNHTLNLMGSGTVSAAGERNRGTLDVDGVLTLMGGTYQATGTNYTTTQRSGSSRIRVYNGTTLVGGADAFTTVCVATEGSRMDLFGGAVRADSSLGFYVSAGKVFLHNATVTAGAKPAVRTTASGAFNHLGGTVTGNIQVEGGTFAMNNDAAVKGNVDVTAGNFSLLAGAVTGGNILVNGAEASATLSNCTVPGTVEITAAKAVTLSGKAVIGALKLNKGILANVSGLTAGSQIDLTAEGIFTTAMDNAQEIIDAGYFTLPIKHTLKVVDNAISLQPMTTAELDAYYNTVSAAADKMTEDEIFTGGAVEALCPYCQQTATWQPLAAATEAEATVLSGHYYLASDLTANTNYYTTGGNTCLHLNGKSVTTSSAQAFQAAAGTELAIMGSGNVTAAGSRATGTLDVKGTMKLMGGNYTATSAYVVAPTAENAQFYMYEGTVVTSAASATSAIVCAQNAALRLMGGDVNCNGTLGMYLTNGKIYLAGTDIHADATYAIRVASGTPTIYHSSGTISGGQRSNVLLQAGIYNFTGGTIEGGSAAGGGNVRLEGGTFNMNGNAVIADGVGTSFGGNVYVENATFNMWGGIVSGGEAPNGGNIYLNGENAVCYIGPAPEGVTGGNPVVTGGTATTGAGGNIYVNKGSLTIAGGTVEQGMAATTGGNIHTVVNATLSGGTVSGGTAGTNGGNICVGGTAALTLSGATVSGGVANGAENVRQYYYHGGGNIYIETNASMTMSAGTVENGISTNNSGGNILNRGTTTISGGSITGGQANYIGGNIMNGAGKLTLSGVTVSGGTGDKGAKHATADGDNVASFGGTLTVSGGNILADSDAQGNAILATYNAKVILDGNAQITNEAAAGNIYMDTQATMQVLATFTGKAGVVFHPSHGAAYGATLVGDTSTGVFSGTLYLEDLNGAKVQGTDANTLVVETQS